MAGKKSAVKKKQPQKREEVLFCSGNYALIPILIVLFFIPIIVRLYVYDPGMADFIWYPNRSESVDMFLWYKGAFLIGTAAMMAVIFALVCINRKEMPLDFKKDIWLIPISGFGLLAILSTIFSKWTRFGMTGIYEQFESLWVVLAYVIVTVYAYVYVYRDEDIRVLRKALCYMLIIECSLGISQMLGKDFFESKLGRTMIVPERYYKVRDELTYNFSGSGNHQVYLTVYNPNYVGSFTALLLPITVMLVFTVKEIWKKVLWAVISVVLLVVTLGSGSKTFILSLGVTFILAIFMLRKWIKKYWMIAVALIVVMVGVSAAYLKYANVDLFAYMKNAMAVHKNDNRLEDLSIEPDHIHFQYDGEGLDLCWEQTEGGVYLKFFDSDGNYLPLDYGAQTQTIIDERFEGITTYVFGDYKENQYLVRVEFSDIVAFNFSCDEEGYYYVNMAGNKDYIEDAPSAIFTDYDGLASGRGYIWSRTIPLLGKYFILGSGADTYVLAFPKHDYFRRTLAGYGNLIITKPHNMYLQMGVQYGTLALLCFLAFVGMYLVQSIKLYWKSDLADTTELFGIGVLLGVFSYLVTGIANDSTLAVAPIFWALIGIGFAINKVVRGKKTVA